MIEGLFTVGKTEEQRKERAFEITQSNWQNRIDTLTLYGALAGYVLFHQNFLGTMYNFSRGMYNFLGQFFGNFLTIF